MVQTFAFLIQSPVLRVLQAIRTRNPHSNYGPHSEYSPYSPSISIKIYFVKFSSVTLTC